MEIKINAKFPGRGDVNFEFSCTEQETAMLIQDPVYQQLGSVLINQLKWESEQCRKQQDEGHWRDMRRSQSNRSTNDRQQQQSDRFDHFRRVMEADRKAQQSHNETVDTAIKSLQDQLNRMFNRIVNNTKF